MMHLNLTKSLFYGINGVMLVLGKQIGYLSKVICQKMVDKTQVIVGWSSSQVSLLLG